MRMLPTGAADRSMPFTQDMVCCVHVFSVKWTLLIAAVVSEVLYRQLCIKLCDFQSHRQGCDMGFVFAFHHEFGCGFHLAFQIPDFGPMSLGMTSILHSKFSIQRKQTARWNSWWNSCPKSDQKKTKKIQLIPKCKDKCQRKSRPEILEI